MSNVFPEWWKHGQKVRTRRDGILTLNIAPDAEYWLTNDKGKDVYVFSADIIGPVDKSFQRSIPMSNIDKRALREAAEKATKGQWAVEFDDEIYSTDGVNHEQIAMVFSENEARDAAFIAAANPSTVLALLDELEAKDKQIADLKEAFSIALSAAGIDATAAAGKGE